MPQKEQHSEQTETHHAFQCGGIYVNIKFAPEGKTLREALLSFLTMQKTQPQK